MTKQVKANAKQFSNDTKVAIKNGTRLIESLALLFVAGFTIYGVYQYDPSTLVFYAGVVSGFIIGLRGSYEFLRHLARKD